MLDAVGGPGLQTFACPFQSCQCEGCPGSLRLHGTLEAVLCAWDGACPSQASAVHFQAMQSMLQLQLLDLRWQNGQKVNLVALDELQDDVVFVNSKAALCSRYLKHHEELRGHLSAVAITHVYLIAHANANAHIIWFPQTSCAGMVIIHAYQGTSAAQCTSFHCAWWWTQWCTSRSLWILLFQLLLLPAHLRKVTALVVDGHPKIEMQCAEAPTKRAGRPRKSQITVLIRLIRDTVYVFPHLPCDGVWYARSQRTPLPEMQNSKIPSLDVKLKVAIQHFCVFLVLHFLFKFQISIHSTLWQFHVAKWKHGNGKSSWLSPINGLWFAQQSVTNCHSVVL